MANRLTIARLGLRLAVFAALLTTISAASQEPASMPPVPIPPALHTARKVFLSNAGADSGLFPSPFSGDPSRGYIEFYAALKQANQFILVDDPAQADLVLELQLTAPNGPSNGSKVNGASNPVPMFRLAVYDAKSHFVLWTLTESVEIALLQKTHDRNFDDALTALVNEFEVLTGKAPTATP